MTADTAASIEPAGEASSVAGSVVNLQRRYPIAQCVIALVLFVYGMATIDGFTTRANIYSILVLSAILSLASIGQTLVVLIGGIDVSIPAMILLGEATTLQLPMRHHWPVVAAIVLGTLVGGLAGGVSGWICHRFNVESLVVTLGMGAVVTGGIQVWTKGYLDGTPPPWLLNLASSGGTTFGLRFPPLLVLWAMVILAAAVILHRTVTGRRLYAVGANPRAASLSLIRPGRYRVCVFAVSAALAALVGVLLAGFAGGDTTAGSPYLFESLAAVVIGGTTFGARGDYSRTAIGAFVIVMLSTILIGKGLSDAAQQVVYGVMILVIVGGYGRDRHIRNRV